MGQTKDFLHGRNKKCIKYLMVCRKGKKRLGSFRGKLGNNIKLLERVNGCNMAEVWIQQWGVGGGTFIFCNWLGERGLLISQE